MKPLILAILFCAGSVLGQGLGPVELAILASAPAGCTTLQDEHDVAETSVTTANSSAKIYLAEKFTAGATYTGCKAELDLAKIGTPTYNVTVEIWSHDGGADEPNAMIGSASDAVAASSLDTSAAYIEFANLSASISSGTTYWIVMKCSSAPAASQEVTWSRSSTAGGRIMRSGDGTTWALESGTRFQRFKLYSE